MLISAIRQRIEKLIAEAVAVAKSADVALLVLGGNEDTNKEGWADNHLGDRDSLDLVGRQNDLVKAVLETGKPTIVCSLTVVHSRLTTSQKMCLPYLKDFI